MTIRVYVIITLVLGLLFFGVRAVEAQAVLELTSSSEKVAVGEAFEVGVIMKQSGLGSLRIGGVEIPGSENFQIAGTSTSTRMQVVNGQSAALTTIVYTLVPTSEGKYILGPVVMEGEESNTVVVEVAGKSKTSKSGIVGLNTTRVDPPTSQRESNGSGLGVFLLLVLVVVLGLGLIVKLSSKKQSTSASEPRDNGVGALERKRQMKEDEEVRGVSSRGDDVLVNTHEIKSEDYYLKIKEDLIVYLEEKHGVSLRQLSSSEITAVLNSKNEGKIQEIATVLHECDQATYAKKQPNSTQLEEMLNKIIN